MGYRVLYDNQLLFDPYTHDRITDTKLSGKLNAASYFDFTISPKNSLHSKLAERAGEVRIYFNNLILFKGEITQIEEDFEGNKSVSCTGALDYLTATRVRPYSTVEGEQPLKAPSNFDGYFQWLIDQHNSNCLDSRKHFSVGVNQGNMLDKNNYIYRASEQRPTTASEIEDKILNPAGGYLFVRYQDDLNILDLYADVHDVNTQIIDYGINMLDFTKTTTAEGQYTAVVATGYTPDPPEGQTNVKMKPITLEGCTDGGTPYSSTIVKMGDRVYDVDAVNRYGYHEYYVSNTDITTYDGLLYYACKTLNTLLSPALTISVKAVDLALLMGDKYKHLQLGQAVRIRSKPRKVDEYLMVNSIDLDLMNPENTTFDLGASYDTLTGQQSAYLKSLNSSINASLDTVASLGDNVKNSAKLAQEAKDTANSATEAANKASNKADSATSVANSASSKADQATETANSASSKADTANSNANKANTTANSAKNTANAANDTANKANAKADTANKTANAASSKADTANDTANKADTKADQAITSAGAANNTANSASSKADDAVKKAEQTQENIKLVQKSVDAANEAASNAQTSADAASTAASAAQATANTAKANASKAQTAADAAQSSANAANSAASKAQKSADAANSAIANTNKEVGTINSTITQIKKDAADTRDELSGQIETVKNTMTTDYAKKTELSETAGTLRSEIETSAAGIKSEVSQNYTTKTELSKTNEKVSKAQDTANKAAAAAASNASDLTEAIKTIGKTTDDLQSQIDGSIQTWFEDGEPNNLSYPAIDWTTDTIKKNHLGDLYYDNTTGYGYRWQIDQNGSYSWKRIVDTDVTKALQDAAKAQGTANSKRRIFVTTPVPPYDVADLWVQGTTGDIMRCQTAKGEGQTYAAADWIKASKYTDDTAVTKLAETVSVTYATKTTVNQLSDRIEQTVESVETVSASAQAAQAAADKANAAAKTAQSTADTAKDNAATAQTSADTAKSAADAAQKAADNAKSAADTAQSAADTANADLVTAKKNLEAVQNQADATDEQVAAAKAAVTKAQGAADKANAAAATAKSAADTAQSTADTAKANAATAQSKANAAASAAATAQSTANTAKANAKKAQDDVDAVKSRVTAAETKITQNSEAIALRATKTEVTNAVNGISIGGRNYVLDSSGVSYLSFKIDNTHQKLGNNTVKLHASSRSDSIAYNSLLYKLTVTDLSEYLGKNLVISAWIYRDSEFQYYGYEFHVIYTHNGSTVYSGVNKNYPYNIPINLEVGWNRVYGVFSIPEDSTLANFSVTTFAINASSTIWISSPKLEIGTKPTDWSPAPEDVASDATTKANAALTSAKTYTDAQLKITSDGITSTVSKTYATKSDLSTTNSNVTKAQNTANSANTAASKAQQTADAVTKNLSDNYTTTSDMNSKIEQTATNITSTVSKTYATKEALASTDANVTKAQNTANSATTAASNAQTAANNVAKDLAANYTTTVDMNSKIEQTASGITSTVSKTYATKNDLSTTNSNVTRAQETADSATTAAANAQKTANDVKTDLATNYTTTTDMNSKISQSAEGITSTVSKTYATKTELSTTNSKVSKAQSDATAAGTAASAAQSTADTAKANAAKAQTTANTANTAAAKAQITANSANTAAGKAQKTADTANTAAGNAQSTADSAVTAAGNAQTAADNAQSAADTAKANAKTAQDTADGVKADLKANYTTTTDMESKISQSAEGITSEVSKTYSTKSELSTTNTNVSRAQSTADSGVSKANAAQSTANTAKSTADSAVTKANNAQTTANLKGIDYSQGKMLYTDPTFASGNNDCVPYNNANTGTVTLTRTGKSVDNPIKNTKNELQIKTIGTAKPGLGGFHQEVFARANAVFIGRIIAKIPVGCRLNFGTNSIGDSHVINWLNNNNGTGKFTEYVIKVVCGATGKFETSFYYYLSGPTATAANPVIWYVAYATVFDMTDVGDALTANRNVETLKTNVETNYVTKSLLTQTAEGITSEVSKTYSTKTELSTINSNVTKAQQKADAASTAAANAQTSANNAKKAADAVSDTLTTSYSTTEQTKSLINQSAESIKSEVSKTYQVKGDYATNSSVRSAIEQSANSITSTVESTYATKATVDALKNIADNAIESWSGTGVPTLTNKPASDWTTDTLKKQHLGDLYYDKATSYGYRFNQNGSGYSWDLIRDTGITQALADAAAANDAAKKAQSTANSGVSKANAAQSTANSASTAASNAQTTANTAKANAATAQADVDKLKTDIPNTYATKSSLTQTAETITAKVETAQSTADGAVTAASKAQQTANSISTTLSKNYTTTADADKKYATQSSLTQTAKSLTSKIGSVETATTKAQADATAAIGKADQAHSDVGSLKTRMSTAETTIKQNTDAIALRATKTEVTNAIDNINVGGRNYIANNLLTSNNLTVESYDINTGLWIITNNNTWSGGVLLYKTQMMTKGPYSCKFGSHIRGFVCTKQFGNDAVWRPNTYYSSLFDSGEAYVVDINENNSLEGFTATENFQFGLVIENSILSAQVGPAKLEKGNKPTDWSAAPEDLISESKKYTDAQLKISSDSITSTVSKTYATKTELDTTNRNVTQAQSTANTATTTANTAKSTADTAKKTADSASSTASTAASNASSALSKASTAETNASSAKTTAEAANKTANTASANASSALSKAGTAETNASSAKTTAEAANKTASTASSNASSALTKANSAASDASTAKSDAANAKSTANTAKNAADTAKLTADTARNELSNLKIGGENLVSNIASNWTAGNWKIPDVGSPTAIVQFAGRISLASYVSIEPNTDYWIKVYSTKAGINALFRVLDSDKNYLSSITWLTNQKFTSPAKAHYLTVGLTASVAVTLDDIRNGAVKVKLEKGNRSTDYSPSYADLSQIASTEAASAQAAADALAEKVTKEYVTQTQFEQTATSLTSRIKTTETTVSGMSTTVKNVNDYMTFAREDNKPTLTIGSSSSSFRTKLTNTSEKFMQGDQTIMELDGVTSTVKTSRVQMGHYQWRDTGTSIQLVYIP